jgi:hypothetical protein
MLVYTPFALCFDYTSWYFYAFSGTNLLTICHSATSYFLLFLCFKKVTQEILSELDETKAEVPIFPNTRRSPKQRWQGARGWPHHAMARVPPGHTGLWCGPLVHLLTPPFRLYILFYAKTLRTRSIFHEKFCSRRRHRPEIGRVQKLFPAPCRGGESSSEVFFITMPTFGVMCEYSTLDYGSIAVARWLSSPPCASCLDLVSCLS